MTLPARVVVCGGAGFIGARVCAAFAAAGSAVTAVDGLVQGTGGSRSQLDGIPANLHVADVADAADLLRNTDLIVDAMGWTAHLAGTRDPLRDLELNLTSHLRVIIALRERGGRVVYLGSRHEYGRAAGSIDETTPLEPIDVQSVHKTAADHHYRVAAAAGYLDVLSVRFGNVFGEGQPMGADAGLIGTLMEAMLAGEQVPVYGVSRRRSCTYAPDLAGTIVALCGAEWSGYLPVNVPGLDLSVGELAERVRNAVGRGAWEERPMPPELATYEVGEPTFASRRLPSLVAERTLTPFDEALRRTVLDVERRLV